MIRKLVSIILLVVIILLTGLNVYLFLNPHVQINLINSEIVYYESEVNEIDLEYNEIEKVAKQPKDLSSVKVAGWMPEWDISDGLTTLTQRPGVFDSVSPIWFLINSDGSLKKNFQTNGFTQINFFKNNNIKLVPSLQEFDAENLSKVLNSSEATSKLITQLVDEARIHNYAGIDLDIESTLLQDKGLFLDFLKDLSAELDSLNKTLVYTALPKWGKNLIFGSFPQTMRTQDYGEIGQIVDEFRIMTYEYSGPLSTSAGPVQPLNWQEQVIQFAIKEGIPREKLVLGVATYSYDWTERNMLSEVDLKKGTPRPNPLLNLEAGVALSNKDIDKIKTNYEITEEFNEEWGEMVMNYEFKGAKRIVVYPNDKSMQLRKQLAADYGIKGIAYWRIGDESDLKL